MTKDQLEGVYEAAVAAKIAAGPDHENDPDCECDPCTGGTQTVFLLKHYPTDPARVHDATGGPRDDSEANDMRDEWRPVMKTLTPPNTREALLADLEPCLFPFDDWTDAELRQQWVAQWVARARQQHRVLMRERTHQHASTTPPGAHETDTVASELTDDDMPF